MRGEIATHLRGGSMRGTSYVLVLSVAALAVTSVAAQTGPSPSPTVPAGVAARSADPQVATGRVTGVVRAPDDARLPGATLTITNPVSGWSVVVVTAGHGGYSGSGLPPGLYDVKVEMPGFQPQEVRGLAVTGGLSREVDFTLQLGALTESVTVRGALVKDNIESREIRDSSARDIGEALGRMNGVSFVRKGGIANDVVLHGYQSRNLTVLIDGERIYGACPN